MSSAIDLVVALVAALVVAFGLLYVTVLTFLGVRHTRREGVAVSAQEELMAVEPDAKADLQGFRFFFLVPALDEQEVIGGTVTALLRDQAGATVVVIDDGSTDRTAEIVESFADTGRVLLVRRVAPHARQGKGRALNAGLNIIREVVRAEAGALTSERTNGPDPTVASKIIIAVMDADGRMTPNATAAVAREFHQDPSIGGLQLVVRIRNRETRTLTFQDMEFWAISGIGQFGRVAFGSVSMGGNGQFTRLSALEEIGPEPWSQSLTEDLDLGISLSVLGWRTTSTPWAYVTQQGVADLTPLLRQRTRWYQGHMMSISRLPELAASRYLPTMRFLEIAAYLALPWLLSLPWPLIQIYLIYQLLFGTGLPAAHVTALGTRSAIMLLWYVLSFAPTVFWGVVYFRRNREHGFWSAVWMSHLLVPWSWMSYLAAYRALGRILMRRHSWAKTSREAEAATLSGVPERQHPLGDPSAPANLP